jgi:cell division inhibitor SepF
MMYVGLADDEYDEYEAYEDPQPQQAQPTTRRVPDDTGPVVRPIPREEAPAVTPAPRPAVVRAINPMAAKVHVVDPQGFNDAQEIGDRLKNGQPVIVVMRDVDSDLSRRLIDFCSGASYVLDATMKRVDKKVYLITPANVEVSADERRRLQERGYIAH